MSIKLHYAELDLHGDIPCIEMSSMIELNAFLFVELDRKKCVYLVSIKDEVFVSDSLGAIIKFIDYNANMKSYRYINKQCGIEDEAECLIIFLQEYPSFEESYEVALMMQEEKELCYKKENQLPKDNLKYDDLSGSNKPLKN